MHGKLLEMLVYPDCKNNFEWDIYAKSNELIIEAKANCTNCSLSFEVKEGIGIFLTDELERNDLWEQVDSNLLMYLKKNKDLLDKLMGQSLGSLNGRTN